MIDDLMTPLDAGVAAADPDRAREQADVRRWFDRLKAGRKFDEEARKQYAVDRRYARGDTGAEVSANLLGTYIDILKAFLYARDPDVDVLPARATEPPSIDALRDAAEASIQQSPEVQQAAAMALQLATVAQQADPTVIPQQVAEQAAAAKTEQLIQEQFAALQQAFQKRQRDNKAFAETLELVIARLWKDGKLKQRGRMIVQSGLTIAVGWLKATWQERMGADPLVTQKIADLRDNIAKAAKLRADMDEQSGAELDATTAEYERQLTALQGQAERVIARGFAIDPAGAENIQVAPGVELVRYLDAPWIAERIPMRKDDAQAEFRLPKEKIDKATKYVQRKPVMRQDDAALVDSVSAKDADGFVTGEHQEAGDEVFVMVWEIWDRDANAVLTGIEGLDCWVRPVITPTATSRFYPYFLLAYGDVDGQRHPQSYVSRSAKLIDEYNRIGSAEAEHRRRVKPKTVFNAGMVTPDDAKRVENATTQEMVGIKPTQPNADLRALLVPVTYAALDPALYDRQRIVQELERIWGVQEALQGAVQTAKTATEAQIQQTGMQARTGALRDVLEDLLSDLALYTAEVALAHLSDEDVRAMVGPDAMWPEYSGPEDLARMVNVEIRAGSSGKPNTTAERQAWSTLLPMLQQGIAQIAQLRGSAPQDVADSVEHLLRLTIERSGDRLDIETLVPPAGPMAMPGVPGMPAMPGAPAADPANAGAPAEPAPQPEPAP